MSYLDSYVSYINKQCKFGGMISNLNDRLKNKEKLLKNSQELKVEPFIIFQNNNREHKSESTGYRMTIKKCFCNECLDRKKMTQFLSAFSDKSDVEKIYNRINDNSTITIDVEKNKAKIFFIPKENNNMRKLKNKTGEYLFKLPSFKSIDKIEDMRVIRVSNSIQLKKYLNLWFDKSNFNKKEEIINVLIDLLGELWCKRSVIVTRKAKNPYLLTFKFLCNCSDIADEDTKTGEIKLPLDTIKDKTIELSKLIGLKTSKVKSFFDKNSSNRLTYISFNNDLENFNLKISHTTKSEIVKDTSNFIYDKAYTNLLFTYKTSNLKATSKNHSNLLSKTFDLFDVSKKYKEITRNLTGDRTSYNIVWGIYNRKGSLSYKYYIYPNVHTFQKDIYNIMKVVSSSIEVNEELVKIDEGYDRFSFILGDKVNNIELSRNTNSNNGFTRIWDGKNQAISEKYSIFYSKNIKGDLVHYTEIPKFLKNHKIEKYQDIIFKYGMPKFSIRLAEKSSKQFNIQYCGLKIDDFITFLKEFKFPKVLLTYMNQEKENYEHLYFDVGYDFKIEKGKIKFEDSAFYGWV